MSPRVTIVGAGNLGLACAARLAAKGASVTMLTGSPDKWSSVVIVEDCYGRRFEGPMSVTADTSCVSSADLVLLCLPGNALRSKILSFAPFLRRGTPLMSIFSGDGFFFVVEKILGVDWPVMGFQRVPFICRTKIPYRLGGITGYKKELFLAHRNIDDPSVWQRFVIDMCDTKTTLLNNFYEAAIVNGNVVLHPARLMSLQNQIDRNGPFERMPLFYEEWDDVASDWAVRIDEEVRAVALSKGAYLMPIMEYYESVDVQSLTRKIRSISAFKGIGSPITAHGKLDYLSRYIQSDIYISLSYIVKIARAEGIGSSASEEILKEFMFEEVL